jgi:hypothetical protein
VQCLIENQYQLLCPTQFAEHDLPDNTKSFIWDVSVQDVHSKFSFIINTGWNNIEETMSMFNLDICKVAFTFHQNYDQVIFIIEEEVKEAIGSHKMTASLVGR